MNPLPTKDQIRQWIAENPALSAKRDIAKAFGIKGDAKIDLKRMLKEMEEEGLIHKQVFPETPPRVEYSLTTKGKGLIPALRIIEAWAKRNYAELVDPVVPN